MQHYRFVDLGFTSSLKPLNTHLFIEINSSSILYMVPSTAVDSWYKSTDKGENWSKIAVTDNNNRIRSAFYDRANDRLYYCEGDNGEVNAYWRYIDLTDDSITTIYSPIFVSFNFRTGLDVIVDGATTYCIFSVEIGPDNLHMYVYDLGTAWHNNIGTIGGRNYDYSYFVDTGGAYMWFLFEWQTGADDGTTMWRWTKGTNTFTKFANAGATMELPPKNQRAMAYDGNDVLFFVLQDTADSKYYLYSYEISTDTMTKGGEYNIALMLDRNNIATVPNEFEKAFSIDSIETVYEIKARQGGIRILQDMTEITVAVIIAITDNFLMNDDGDMFEFTDVTNEISTIRYNDGIMGILKKGVFTVHPDFHINWNKGDSIKIYDQYDQLEFHGLITDKNRNSRGIYVYKIDSFTNEVYRKTYEKAYSGDDSDTKQKDIIDNACDFCYRSSSIVGTTTNYDYEYNRAIIYLFWLARFLERQVPYIEPDGKIWTKAHDGLVRNDMIYPGTYINNPTLGLMGTDIEFVDIDSSGGNAEVIIIAEKSSHKKILRLTADAGGDDVNINHNVSAQPFGTIEFFVESTDVTNLTEIQFRDSAPAGVGVNYFISNDNHRYFDGAAHNIVVANDNILNRIRIDFECTAGGYQGLAQYDWHIYIDGTLYGDFNMQSNISEVDTIRIRLTTNADYSSCIDAWGESWDPAYNIGDNEVAWDIANKWQEVFLIDIPGLEERIQGFFDGNSGITRNTIRYRDNTTTIRPVAATRDPIEQLQGIIPLNEFRDPKIEAATEANQLGDNRYAIWSSDIIFLGLRVEGQGYLQPGKTIHIENTGQITIAESNLLLLSFERDPKNDIYINMILSDNIIFPSEFTNLHNTSSQQTHTGIVQSFKNQADIIAHLTPEGGLALRLTNKTGVASVKGTIVEAHATTDNAFRVCDANSVEAFGIVYEDGIPDGSECLIVIAGRAQVLLKDATASTRGNWVEVSDVAGRADATGASPAASPQHFQEIGHSIESKGADTDVLAYIIIHFL